MVTAASAAPVASQGSDRPGPRRTAGRRTALTLSYEDKSSTDNTNTNSDGEGDDDDNDEGPHEECGVFGVWAPPSAKNAARVAFFALYALNHRGQESAGIATGECRDGGGSTTTLGAGWRAPCVSRIECWPLVPSSPDVTVAAPPAPPTL
jgi:hypothetical protein